jgi:hypothetical protein
MAFNVSDYVKPTAKPFTRRITDPVVSSSSRGFNSGAASVAQATADQLLATAGSSIENIKEISDSTTFNALSSVDDRYYAITGINPMRTTRADLEQSRFGRLSTNEYLKASDPATRIGAAVKNGSIEIISVI